MARAKVALLRVEHRTGGSTRRQVPAILRVNLSITAEWSARDPARRERIVTAVVPLLYHTVAAAVTTNRVAIITLLVTVLHAVAANDSLTGCLLVFCIGTLASVFHSLGAYVRTNELLAVIWRIGRARVALLFNFTILIAAVAIDVVSVIALLKGLDCCLHLAITAPRPGNRDMLLNDLSPQINDRNLHRIIVEVARTLRRRSWLQGDRPIPSKLDVKIEKISQLWMRRIIQEQRRLRRDPVQLVVFDVICGEHRPMLVITLLCLHYFPGVRRLYDLLCDQNGLEIGFLQLLNDVPFDIFQCIDETIQFKSCDGQDLSTSLLDFYQLCRNHFISANRQLQLVNCINITVPENNIRLICQKLGQIRLYRPLNC